MKEIEKYCQQIGCDQMLVQGAGGNLSWKEGEVLWVKASGTWLKNALNEEIFVPVDLHPLQSKLCGGDFDAVPCVISQTTLKPSIETLLHALMPQKIVLHLHAIEVLSWMVRSNCLAELTARLRNFKHTWTWVGYQKPGAELAKEVAKALKSSPAAEVIFMANHGVVIGGDSIRDIDEKVRSLTELLLVEPLNQVLTLAHPVSPRELIELGYSRVVEQGIEQLALDQRLFDRIERDWALYPDHVVFLGARPHVIREISDEFGKSCEQNFFPDIVFLKDVGVFSKVKLSAAKLAQLRCYYDVLSRQDLDQELAVLSQQAIATLLNWDAEVYRQSVAI